MDKDFLWLLLESGAILRFVVAGLLGLFLSGEEDYPVLTEIVVLRATR